ncbi:hypothetical protein BHE74_00053359 [Ensete ventricosum]|nr:hypothetical protein GW17_00052729 [Ensete ventricosum]RWW41162.1 hypothetical protein BHE74_00053359 [Ensete ventricosum]
MDRIVLVAIEEVCGRAAAGIPVAELWPSLRGALSGAGLPLCDAVYKVIWVRLLAHPGLRFEAHGSPLGSQDPSIQSLEEAQRVGVKIVAEDHLRDSFLGIYDLKASSSDISQIQRAALERLAAARKVRCIDWYGNVSADTVETHAVSAVLAIMVVSAYRADEYRSVLAYQALLGTRFSLPSGKTPYRLVHTGPTADQYADWSLPGGTTKIGRRLLISAVGGRFRLLVVD